MNNEKFTKLEIIGLVVSIIIFFVFFGYSFVIRNALVAMIAFFGWLIFLAWAFVQCPNCGKSVLFKIVTAFPENAKCPRCGHVIEE